MAKTRIRPNGNSDFGSDVIIYGGSASIWAALSDVSDATYVRPAVNPAGSITIPFDMGTVAIPASSDIAGVSAGLRSKCGATPNEVLSAYMVGVVGGWYNYGTFASWNGTTIADVVLTSAQAETRYFGSLWTQALLDALHIEILDNWGSTGYFYEVYADVYHYARLSASVAISGGTPVTAVSKPTFNLTFTAFSAVDADQALAAWNQLAYEAKVFNAAQYNAVGFDPSTSAPTWSGTGSATMASAATTATANVTSGAVLPNDSYRVYTRAAWNFPSAVWGVWAYTAFAMNIAPTDPPTTAVVLDNGNGCVTCAVTPIAKTGHTLPLIRLQRSADAGASWTDVYGASSLAGAFGVASTIHDYTAPRGVALQYRAAVTTTFSGNQMTSLWTTVSAMGVGNDIIPIMTSNTAPSGVASTGTVYDGHAAWHAFDDSGSTWWASNVQPSWLRYQFAAPKTVLGYRIKPHPLFGAPPVTWTFQGSNDGLTWTALDARSGVMWPIPYGSQLFPLPGTTAYTYYRVYVTTGSGPYCGIEEFEMFTAGASSIPCVGWNLKVAKNPALNMIGANVLHDPGYTQDENLHVSRPIGRKYPVVVSLSLGGADGPLELEVHNESEWTKLRTLLEYRAPIFLESSYGWARWIRIISRSWTEFGPAPVPIRTISLGFVEVAADV